MAIMGIVVTFFTTTPIDYLLLAVTAVCATLAYFGKNLIPWLHSDSPPASLSLINIASGLLVALGAAILEAAGTFIVSGAIIWSVIWKVTAYTTGTYLISTFFAPPYSKERKRLFAGKAYISRYLKMAGAIGLFLFISIGVSAQGHFSQFFKKTNGTSVATLRTEGDKSFEWYVKPTAQLTAMNLNYNPDTKVMEATSFSAAGIGIGYQHYIEYNGALVNNYGINALFIINGANEEAGYGVAATVNALGFVNIGGGRDFTNKRWLILLGGSWNF
ncbi:MAG: hypothetical protein D4R45_07705 [Planctomycetaceae bacterium]|nr:MAG: hypothetical protein D4R45_07705 [Planctomycetaceae bacterium]